MYYRPVNRLLRSSTQIRKSGIDSRLSGCSGRWLAWRSRSTVASCFRLKCPLWSAVSDTSYVWHRLGWDQLRGWGERVRCRGLLMCRLRSMGWLYSFRSSWSWKSTWWMFWCPFWLFIKKHRQIKMVKMVAFFWRVRIQDNILKQLFSARQ